MITVSKEDYLKAILVAEGEGETVISATLAHWLNVSPPAVTMAVRRLKKDDHPKPYSSLQAVDLHSVREDEYLACSVAHYLGLAKPSGRMQMPPIGGDLGVSLKYKCDQTAYTSLDATLKLLNREFGIDT